jgi:hypothetical protein
MDWPAWAQNQACLQKVIQLQRHQNEKRVSENCAKSSDEMPQIQPRPPRYPSEQQRHLLRATFYSSATLKRPIHCDIQYFESSPDQTKLQLGETQKNAKTRVL